MITMDSYPPLRPAWLYPEGTLIIKDGWIWRVSRHLLTYAQSPSRYWERMVPYEEDNHDQ